MPFIAEKMPEEAKEKLPFKVFTDYNGEKPTLGRWAVNKEQDAYIVLINKEGGGIRGYATYKALYSKLGRSFDFNFSRSFR